MVSSIAIIGIIIILIIMIGILASSSVSSSFDSTGTTDTKLKRLIYFTGHKDHKNSILITKIYSGHTTLPTIDAECASRTLLNLLNLHAARGNIVNGILDLSSSMSGPQHYFGYVSPFLFTTIDLDSSATPLKKVSDKVSFVPTTHLDNVSFKQYELCSKNSNTNPQLPMPCIKVECNWIPGIKLSEDVKKKYRMIDEYNVSIKSNKRDEKDSLFSYPGVLEIDQYELNIPFIADPQNYVLSAFKCQIVRNDIPFRFNNISQYKHAQHKLRVVTYNYGPNYVNDYLMHGSGVFLEKHEFVQSITPSSPECGGYVMIAKGNSAELEIVAISIPYGYTLLVEPYCIHGDSGLVGTYIMSMTGNHVAMLSTADTVYLKSQYDGSNIKINTGCPINSNNNDQDHLLLSSNKMPLSKLKKCDLKLKEEISKNIGWRNIYWKPVIWTPKQRFGWDKTMGVELPEY